jgi:hypothetical protein
MEDIERSCKHQRGGNYDNTKKKLRMGEERFGIDQEMVDCIRHAD